MVYTLRNICFCSVQIPKQTLISDARVNMETPPHPSLSADDYYYEYELPVACSPAVMLFDNNEDDNQNNVPDDNSQINSIE